MKACQQLQLMFCSREYQPTSRLNQQNERSTSNFIRREWVRGTALFQRLGKLQLRASNYKNHRIFALRCIHKELVQVSIKLKTTLRTDKARKIIRTAERHLPQARVKAINSILDNVTKQSYVGQS